MIKYKNKILYQTNYSDLYAFKVNYDQTRILKAQKTFEVLNDYSNRNLKNLSVLELGCYKGDISYFLSKYFKIYFAIDIDKKVINIAKNNYSRNNLIFGVANTEELNFTDCFFDIVICSHIYEHIPFPDKMMKEIYRILKNNGFCYFAGGNKLNIIEPHYKLPFLSWLPKFIANKYLRITRKGFYYYENHKTYGQLKKLTNNFKIIDYTYKIVNNPSKFSATELLQENTFKQKIAKFIYKNFRYFYPTYIWILQK